MERAEDIKEEVSKSRETEDTAKDVQQDNPSVPDAAVAEGDTATEVKSEDVQQDDANDVKQNSAKNVIRVPVPDVTVPDWNEASWEAVLQLKGIAEGISSWDSAQAVEIAGRIGSGKTTVIQRLMEDLKGSQPESCVVIYFNASIEGDYDKSVVALLASICHGFEEFGNRDCNAEAYNKAREAIRRKKIRTDWKKVGLGIAETTLKVLEKLDIPVLSTVAYVVDLLLPFTKGTVNGIKKKKTDGIKDNDVMKEYESYGFRTSSYFVCILTAAFRLSGTRHLGTAP
ncbi:MAG: hypothetical protein LUD51_07790 [Clostridia bacterium]|nr:hypothetical protein [Clostridia bacterium]